MRRPTWHLGPMPFFGVGGLGGASDSAQSSLLDAMERFLPLPSFDGATNEDQLVDGMNKAAAVLQADGVDLSLVREDSPPPAYNQAASYVTDNQGVLTNTLPSALSSMTSLMQSVNVPPAPIQWSRQDLISVLAYAWKVSSTPIPAMYATGADVSLIESGVADQQTIATDIRRRMMVFRFIVMMHDQGITTPDATPQAASGFGQGMTFSGLGIEAQIVIGISIIVALLVAAIVWIVMSNHTQNVWFEGLCVNPDTRLPDDVRNVTCPALLKDKQQQDSKGPPGLNTAIWVLGGVALVYLLIVYGIPQYQASEKRLATS